MQPQRTIKNEVILEGTGLQTGKPSSVKFLPSEENSGVIFVRTDLSAKPVVNVRKFLESGADAESPDRRSTVALDGSEIQTVEHLMASLWALSIDNIKIEINNVELPGLDGSALGFFNALKKAGARKQNAPRKTVEIKDVLWCEGNNSFLGIFPSQAFKVSYVLDYPDGAIERQCVSFELDEKTFEEEIAGARTFCLKEEAEALLKMGYGRGADFQNTLVMDKGAPVQNKLRFPDECARHKVLDLIGDLYLLGRPVKGRVIAVRSGHKLNLGLVKKINGKYL